MATLQDIKGPYTAIFSLGNNCLPAIQLKAHGLRKFAGPLDWMSSLKLPQVTRLLRNRFQGMLHYPNLMLVNQATHELYNVVDVEYELYLNHDFFVHSNFPPHFAAYPEVKAKYDRRIARFLQTLASGGRILFIRTDSSYEDVKELEAVLTELCAGPFHLLVVNHAPVAEIEWLNWGLNRVCAIHMPNQDEWYGNGFRWTFLFNGIYLV